jgi:hypothetical protein
MPFKRLEGRRGLTAEDDKRMMQRCNERDDATASATASGTSMRSALETISRKDGGFGSN